MIPEHQRAAIVDNYVRGLLNSDRCAKNFMRIERLWQASGLTNKDLVEELLSDRENAADDFKDGIFWDMIWVLKDSIMEDDALRGLFSDLYAKRFPSADKYIRDLESKVSQGKNVVFGDAEFNKFHSKYSRDESGYLVFRVFTSDVLITNDCIDHDYSKYNYDHTRKILDKEAEAGDKVIVFTDGSDAPVFSSKFFERFVKKQKQALADYLSVDVEKLGAFYDRVMTIQEDLENNSIGFTETAFGRISSSMIEMIWLHGGSAFWLANIQSLNRKNKFGYKYRPNFDKLFEKYCRASVVLDYPCFIRDEGTFTPLTLARKCGFEELEALAVSMGYMYMCDVMHQMYIQMQKQYYANFSWERFHNRDLQTRYEAVVSDLKASLSTRDAQLHNLRVLYNTLRDNLEKKNDLALIRELQDKEKLLRTVEEKDAEIKRLKEVIASQNQMIEQLQAAPEDNLLGEDESRFDSDSENIIYRHKYLFVGDITALGFEELKRKFPASVFMEANTVNISQVQVDAIVYLIQSMGHSMYYKCKNTPALRDVKIIYYNGRGNTTSLFEVMERELQKQN